MYFIRLTQDIIRTIEKTKTDSRDKPAKDVVIADSGSIPVEEPFPLPEDK